MDFRPPPAHYPGMAEDRLVYIDTMTSAFYLEDPADVAAYAAVFEQIRADALSPQDSCELMHTVAADLKL